MLKIQHTKILTIISDSFIWILSILLSTIIRYDGSFPISSLYEIFKLSLIALSLSIFFGNLLSLYSNRYEKGSIEESIVISVSIALVTTIIFCMRIIFSYPSLPRSVSLVSGFIAIILMLVTRVISRPGLSKIYSKKVIGQRTLIYGAGITGRHIAEQMLREGDTYNPIGFLDDDLGKANLRILGRPVLGTIDEFQKIYKTSRPEMLVIAISNISSLSILKIEERCKELGVRLRIIPDVFKIVSGTINLTDLHDVSEEDLLGRIALKTNETDIDEFFKNTCVLVTGAGGSIGSEISRQLTRYGLSGLYMLDRDETALLMLELSLKQNQRNNRYESILADIRDVDRVSEIFETIKPDIVFHAAALKHLNFLEKFPGEAHKTNVVGTQNILYAAKAINVNTFINISTDKAAQPSSVLGRSKLLTEQLTAGINNENTKSKYLSVRFGNVIGSNGSFITTFRNQIKNGGPVTVTHPDVTRYFMTISEAVHLVLKSAVIGKNGETLILEMGEPMKIDLIARRMISASGRDIEIIYTGLNPGEKLNEVLFNSNEKIEKSENDYIMRTKVKPINGGRN